MAQPSSPPLAARAPAPMTLAEIAALVGGEVGSGAGFLVAGLAAAHSDDESGLAFAERRAYLDEARASRVGAVIVPPGTEGFPKPHVLHPKPREAFFALLRRYDRPHALNAATAESVHPTAVVEPGATLAPDVTVGAYAFVAATATLGPDVRVFPFAYVGEGCHVGERTQILPHAVLVRDVTLGARCVVGPGAVLGQDGFGYVWDGERQLRVPQVGRVEIGDDVEIGALTTVDRATAGATVVGEGTKLDNLVQIAHNCRIGRHNVVASFVGVSGSCTTGDRCSMGGQVGLADHSHVGDDVHLGARTGINGRLDEPGMYFGYPPLKFREALRVASLTSKLPDLNDRVKELERRLAELENRP